MKPTITFAAALLVIVGLNWGLFELDRVASATWANQALAQLPYAAVGLAALYQYLTLESLQSRWNLSSARVS
ncbi:MAG: uncharacterized membrane protein YuzA (DUF378 family) [Planctomycetota bacterium]|jgi:uncharacterized membrane protein YuzA (DUF378 family)